MSSNVVIALDHDGTLSPYDIGKRYLSKYFSNVYKRFGSTGSNEEKFSDAVEKLRSGAYNEFIQEELGVQYDPERDHGIELALMILLESKYDGLTKSAIDEIVSDVARKNHILKTYAPRFLKHDGYTTWVSTAGIDEFLKKVYDIYEINNDNDFYVVGTRLKYNNGKPSEISRKNGRYQKPENLKKDLGMKKRTKIIAVGDGSGDSNLLEYASKRGFSISSGERAAKWSNVVVNDEDFGGEIAAIMIADGLLKKRGDKEILSELEEFFGKGENVKTKISKGDVENPLTDKVIEIVNYFWG